MTGKKTHTVLFDCERMKYPHTGLYHFCLNLGKHLLRTNPANQKLCFYTPPAEIGVFGNEECYFKQNSLHKFLMPNKGKVDIWHTTYQKSNYIPAGKMKLILTVHDLNLIYEEGRPEHKKRKYLESIQKRIDRANQIVAISEFALNDLKQHLNIENKPSEVIYNGCNIEEITSLQEPVLKPTSPFLFTIGTIVEKKNFHVLPCLLAGNDMQLVIAGITQNESYQNQIINEAKKWKAEKRLVFTGPVSENDKQWYFKNCEAFVFPSTAEGFGLPVVEAMYFGKPVILSTCTSLPEIGGSEAYYFKSFDPEDMQATLKESLQHYYVNNPSEAIKKRSKLFNWEESAFQYHRLYDKLLDK